MKSNLYRRIQSARNFCVAQMLRLRIALYRHIPTGAVEKCFQLPISFFFFCLFPVFWAATEFSFSAILFLFFSFFFFSWVFWAGTEFFFIPFSLFFFFFFFFGVFWAGAEFYILQFFSNFPHFSPFFPHTSNYPISFNLSNFF